ncbi:hypothetical protein Hdeb2414_s0001g00016181 [Helianthus debilis subsp. tardiflorus]
MAAQKLSETEFRQKMQKAYYARLESQFEIVFTKLRSVFEARHAPAPPAMSPASTKPPQSAVELPRILATATLLPATAASPPPTVVIKSPPSTVVTPPPQPATPLIAPPLKPVPSTPCPPVPSLPFLQILEKTTCVESVFYSFMYTMQDWRLGVQDIRQHFGKGIIQKSWMAHWRLQWKSEVNVMDMFLVDLIRDPNCRVNEWRPIETTPNVVERLEWRRPWSFIPSLWTRTFSTGRE